MKSADSGLNSLNRSQLQQTLIKLRPSEIEFDDVTDVRSRPYTDAEVASLRASLERDGQAQPILVRPPANGGTKFRVIAGRGRVLASLDDDRPLLCYVRDVDDAKAYWLAIAENLKRKQMSPIDLATQFRRFNENGESASKIASHFQVSPATVTEGLKLLSLPPDIQQQVHTGELATSAALALVRVPEAERPAVVEAAKEIAATEAAEAESSPTTRRSKKRVGRGSQAAADEPRPVSASGKGTLKVKAKHIVKAARKKGLSTPKGRSMSDVRDFFASVGGGGAYPKVMTNFANFIADDWSKGKGSDAALLNRWNQIAGEMKDFEPGKYDGRHGATKRKVTAKSPAKKSLVKGTGKSQVKKKK